VFLVGVLISQGKQQVISQNIQGIDFGKEFNNDDKRDNILLLRDSTLTMGDYQVTYTATKEEKPNTLYLVNYIRKNKGGETVENFVLEPNAQVNPKMGLLANPDTKHYLTKDVFTHVTSLPDNRNLKDTSLVAELAVNDTFATRTALIVFDSINPAPNLPADFNKEGKLVVGIHLQVKSEDKKTYTTQPVFVIDLANGNEISSIPGAVDEMGITAEVVKIDPKSKKVTLNIREQEKPADFIILKAIVFPYINLVWLGGILTFLGTFISMYRRGKEAKAMAV
jgi:cytochrome c-type biogenesis protein CcmF